MASGHEPCPLEGPLIHVPKYYWYLGIIECISLKNYLMNCWTTICHIMKEEDVSKCLIHPKNLWVEDVKTEEKVENGELYIKLH